MLALTRTLFLVLLAMMLVPARMSRADYIDPQRLPFLHVGDRAPAFTGMDDRGQKWDSAQHYGKKMILVCFYLGDFFKNCTEEMRVLRDHRNQLAGQDVEILAVSGDSVATHQLFKKTHRLNFNLLADEKGTIGRVFGVAMSGGGQLRMKHPETGEQITLRRGVTAARWTFLIDTDGKIRLKETNVKIKEQPRQILDALRQREK